MFSYLQCCIVYLKKYLENLRFSAIWKAIIKVIIVILLKFPSILDNTFFSEKYLFSYKIIKKQGKRLISWRNLFHYPHNMTIRQIVTLLLRMLPIITPPLSLPDTRRRMAIWRVTTKYYIATKIRAGHHGTCGKFML